MEDLSLWPAKRRADTLLNARIPPNTRFLCSFFPYCGGHRAQARRQEPVVLQLRGEQLETLAVCFPDRTAEYEKNFVESRMKRLQLWHHNPPIEKVSDGLIA
jgi:hypothetical protein